MLVRFSIRYDSLKLNPHAGIVQTRPQVFFWGGRGVWDEVGYSDLGLSLKWESFVSHLVASGPKNANIFSPPSVGCLA